MTDEEILELEALINGCRAETLKGSLFDFVKEFWSTIVSDPYVHNWHIEYLCDEVQLVLDKYVLHRGPHIPSDKWYRGITENIKKNLVVNVPPGTSKSTIISRMAPAWLWANDPSKTTIGNTIDGGNATEFATKSRDIIQSELFRSYFPDVKIRRDISAKTFYSTTAGGTRYSYTTRGSKTGKHAHCLIDDDPMDYATAQSANEVKSCIDGFKEFQTRKKDKETTPYILVMQKLSNRDTASHALKVFGDNVRHICLPAENLHNNITPASLEAYYIDGLLDPVRLSRQILTEQRSGLNDDSKPISDIAYNIQFNQAVQSDEGLMYPNINFVPRLPENRDGVIRYSFTDVADTGADFFCTWFLEVNGGRIFVFDAIYTQQGSGVTSKAIKAKIELHNSVVNKIETNNQGSVFITLLHSLGVNVSGYTNTGNKDERINAYSQFMTFLHFVEPGSMPYHTAEYSQAVKHLESYPNQGKADDGKDDAEDAITEALRYLFTNARHLFNYF